MIIPEKRFKWKQRAVQAKYVSMGIIYGVQSYFLFFRFYILLYNCFFYYIRLLVERTASVNPIKLKYCLMLTNNKRPSGKHIR